MLGFKGIPKINSTKIFDYNFINDMKEHLEQFINTRVNSRIFLPMKDSVLNKFEQIKKEGLKIK